MRPPTMRDRPRRILVCMFEPQLLFAQDSPFRRVPEATPPQQVAALDGIRFTIDMLSIAFWRLANTLILAATLFEPDQRPLWVCTSAFMDAWSVVDSAYRLLGLVEQMRGMKQTPAIK